MKLKGISTFEHHVEKLVFALFFVFLLFVLVLQLGLLGGGAATVSVGSRDVPLEEASKAVADQAQQKLAQMNSDRVDEQIPTSLPNVESMFAGALRSDDPFAVFVEVGNAQVPGVGGTTGPEAPIDIPQGADVVFAKAEPPAPSKPMTRVHGCTIDPFVVAQVPDLQTYLPPAQPYDVRAISVETKFDAEAFRARMTSSEGETQPVPTNYWEGRAEILDVVWVRQTLGSDGQWGEEESLGSLPGRFTMRDRVTSDEVDITELQTILDDELANRGDVRRPTFYSYVSGEPWRWPSFGVQEDRDPALQDRIDRLLRQLLAVRNRIEDIERRLSNLGWIPPRHEWPEPGDDWKWPEIPKTWRAQFGGGGGGDRPPPPEDTRDREGEARKNLEEQLAEQKTAESDLIAQLNALGVNDLGQNLSQAGQDELAEPLDSLSQPSLERITLWHHDLGAQPGATYRYQARVRITNPYFGKENELPTDQQDLAEGLYVESPASDWSDPVEVMPDVVYFVRNASPADADGAIASSARAGLELFEFYYGYWRRASVIAYPGDTLVGEARLPGDLLTWAIDQNAGAVALGEESELEESRLITTSAVFLDVAPTLGRDDVAQVFLASADGSEISVRLAGLDGAGMMDRLASSADAGLRAQLRLPGTAVPVGNSSSPQAPDGSDPSAPDNPFDGGDDGGNDGGGSLPSRESPF